MPICRRFAATCCGAAHRLCGNQHRQRSLRSAQFRPHRRDHRLPGRFAGRVQAQGFVCRRSVACPDRETEPQRTPRAAGRALIRERLRLDGVHRSHECVDRQGFQRFFRRAGAWLALFHCFVSVDMHQENIIAVGEHPVPIDLEMILQAAEPWGGTDIAGNAGASRHRWEGHQFGNDGRSPSRVQQGFQQRDLLDRWSDLELRSPYQDSLGTKSIPTRCGPRKMSRIDTTIPNLPHIDGVSCPAGR